MPDNAADKLFATIPRLLDEKSIVAAQTEFFKLVRDCEIISIRYGAALAVHTFAEFAARVEATS